MQNTLEVILKQTIAQQNQYLRYLVKLPFENKVKVMELYRNIFHSLRQANENVAFPILSYAALILSIKKFQDEINQVDNNALKLREKSIRSQPKKDRIIGYWALIKTLKNHNNLSFREIKKYLKKYHKFEVSHSVIYEAWKKYEIKN
jgi:hypothetical protein